MMTKGKSRSSSSSSCEDGGELRRGPWTLDEDNLLIHYITTHGEGRWNTLAKFSGLKRTGKSCRLRWLNYLKPDIKRGNLTPHEQLLILELHSRWGNRWSKIAQNLPGRTDNEIKNYWRTRVQKQARQLKIDSNSKKFVETIRMFWMPRLLEKMEQDSSIASSPTSSISTMELQKFTAPSPILTRVPVPSVPTQNQTTMVNNVDNNFLAQSSEISGYFPSYGPPDYHVEVPGYNMQEIETPDKCGLSRSHVAELDWFGEDMGEVFWNNSEEVWELMNQGVCLDRR